MNSIQMIDKKQKKQYIMARSVNRLRLALLICIVLSMLIVIQIYNHMWYSRGFWFILIQCLFKSYGSLDTFRKSGKVYSSATEVLETNAGPLGMGFHNSEFPTDKASTQHNYTRYYDLLLKPYSLMDDATLIEIGVKKGGSIKMFREWFRPGARLWGMDIDKGVPRFDVDPNIKVVIGNTVDPDSGFETYSDAFRGLSFDVIIDDGCHKFECVLGTFTWLSKFLTSRGIYIIEDADPAAVAEMQDVWKQQAPKNWEIREHVDKTWSLLIFYPEESLAPRLDNGLKQIL